MSVTPIGDYLLVRPDPTVEETEEGIHIPEGAQKKAHRGTVVAVGPRVKDDYPEITLNCRIIWIHELYSYIMLEEGEYLLMTPSDIGAIENGSCP
jgi:co-chaperonin GroES (HSP10)